MNSARKFTPRVCREKTASSSSDTEKDAVNVFCRLRPLEKNEDSSTVRLVSPTVLSFTTPTESKSARKEVHCMFKHIFTAYATQNDVFKAVALPLLEDLLKGKNGLLFTYGVTGSGKTHTLTGNPNDPGIMPKCISTVFNSIADCQAPKFVIKPDRMNGFDIQCNEEALRDDLADFRSTPMTPRHKKQAIYTNDGIKLMDINESSLYSVFVSYIEIYNNTVFDLLDETAGKSLQRKILREDCQKNMYVNGVIEVEVKSAEEAFNVFNTGQNRKRMGNTVLNSVSSRSHSIFNIRVVQFQQASRNERGEAIIPENNLLVVGQLSLVDLAGSERTNRTQNTGQLLREASQINNSLMTLRTCLEALRDNQLHGNNRLVPYRDSRLTHLFKGYFEGEGRVEMIVCVNPSLDDFEENLQVMKFAEVTKDVRIAKAEPRYYTPLKKTIEKKTAKSTTKAAIAVAAFNLGPKINKLEFNWDNLLKCRSDLHSLTDIFVRRERKMEGIQTEIIDKADHFRQRLLKLTQGNILRVSELKSTQIQVKKERQKSARLEAKVAEMDNQNAELMRKNEELQDIIRTERNIIAEKDMKISKNVLENERAKQKYALRSEKMTHELDAKLRRQRTHLEAAMKAKDTKIQMVRELLNKDIAAAEVDMEEKENQTEVAVVPQTPKSRRPVGVVPTSARRRRSRSTGDVWLEHNSIKPVPLGTVLQPSMKKRKSVTKLSKASEVTNPKQTKYCLLTQEQGCDGELDTRVYKADILPTCGGGAQVVFNDVEKLTQEAPI